jgi:hypothetical protein
MRTSPLSPILALVLLSPTVAWSQALEVTGQVKTPDEQPVAGVPVLIRGPFGNTVVFTDETGRWTLYQAPAGTYSAKALTQIPAAGAAPSNSAREIPFIVEEKNLVDTIFSTSPKLQIEKSIVVPQRF